MKTWSKKVAWKLPCFAAVVVTDMASCPPAAMRYGHEASGDTMAELMLRSVLKHLSRLSVDASKSRTQPSPLRTRETRKAPSSEARRSAWEGSVSSKAARSRRGGVERLGLCEDLASVV